MKFEPQVGVTKMLDSNSGEIIHLFEVMQKHGAKCSLEFKYDKVLDPLFGITMQPIELIEYVEHSGGPDAVVIELGELSLGFELGTHSFFKEISDCQILICIASDDYSAWFNSGVVPPEGIEEARNYQEVEEGLYPEDVLPLSQDEANLIAFVRSLSFEDVLDAVQGIQIAQGNASAMVTNRLAAGETRNAGGFRARAEALDNLQELLGRTNTDYCNLIYPDEMKG